MNSHIFEISSILEIEQKIWITSKSNSKVPIARLSKSDFNLFKSGVLKKNNNKIVFENEAFYIPEWLVDIIFKSKETLDSVRFSFREFLDKEIIDNSKSKIDLSSISHLKNSKDHIYLISPKYTKDKYVKHIDKLLNKLKDEGYSIKDIYYINNTFFNQSEDDNIYKRGLILCSHMVGKNIENSKFTTDFIRYDITNYYSDDISITNSLLSNLQREFDKIYKNSYLDIKNSLKCNLNLITTNELNRLIQTKVDIHPIVKESLKWIKTYKIFENQNNNSELIKELEKYRIKNYTINDDGSIDVYGDVDLVNKKLDKIPFNFHKVTGDFWCHYNNLTSLKGCPKDVGGDFYCSYNKLTDLIGGPQDVGDSYYCYNNQLETLEGCAGDIGGSLYCRNNKLTSLDCAAVINGNIYCRRNGFLEEPEFFGFCGGKIIWKD